VFVESIVGYPSVFLYDLNEECPHEKKVGEDWGTKGIVDGRVKGLAAVAVAAVAAVARLHPIISLSPGIVKFKHL